MKKLLNFKVQGSNKFVYRTFTEVTNVGLQEIVPFAQEVLADAEAKKALYYNTHPRHWIILGMIRVSPDEVMFVVS